jgi:Mannosyltransferase (PIG-V)
MPVRDLRLSDLPAEQHVLVAPARREVHEPLVEVLYLDAEVVELLHGVCDAGQLALDLLGGLAHLARRKIAAVAGDPCHELRLLRLRGKKRAAVSDHAFGERTHLCQRVVRLRRCEEPFHRAAMIDGAVGVGQRLREDRPVQREMPAVRTATPALGVFLWSRLAIWLAAIFAFLWFEPNRHPNAARWDSPLIHDLGYATDVWARWDSVFFVRIAERGYDDASAAFGPLYPALVWALGHVLLGHYVLAGVVVSIAAAVGAFVLFYRVAEEHLGADGAQRAVLYLAVFPMALFLQAVYSESLFLLLVLGAFVLAERGRFEAAGLATGLAILTRVTGVALVPALALLAWRSRNRPRAFAGLALAAPVAAVYPLVLWRQVGDPWAFAHAQDRWHRHLSPAGPLGGIWDALTNWIPSGAGRQHAIAVNAEALAFLVLFVGLAVIVWRRFGAAYGLFAAVSLAIPLSFPSQRWPLLSLPRFGLVIFPFFLALAALAAGRPRVHTAIVACSALLLGVAVVQWALWQWVA